MTAVDPAALLIGLREGLEALLVLGILLGLLRRLGHGDKAGIVWTGAALGVLASVVVGLAVEAAFSAWFEDTGAAAFEVVVALVAVGILTYMVVWMYRHTTTLVATVKRTAQVAADEGRWALLGGLAFFTVFREGLETVLFYGARLADVGWPSLLVSGAIGFAVSAVIAYAIFRLTVQVSLKAFFGITGFLLVFIAAGLLVHVVHAASDLGWLPHGDPLWDTSAALPDDGHWLGGPLHALIGYEDQPTALQLLLYLGYLVGVGGWYATHLVPQRRQKSTGVVAAAAFVLLLAGFAVAGAIQPGASHDEGAHGEAHAGPDHAVMFAPAMAALEGFDGKVGVLVRAHGEPVHYNASTYESFRAFIIAIWPYTGLPMELLTADEGTVLIDDAHPFAQTPQQGAHLVDAWLGKHAAGVPLQDGGSGVLADLCGGSFYIVPGPLGPGWGEGDLLEMCGLSAYRDWIKMQNESPMYGAVKDAWGYLETHLNKHFGDKVVVAFANHIDPKMDPAETTEAAAKRLADAGVSLVVDAYMSSVHSDAMDTCMMAPHTLHALSEAGFTGPVVKSGMAGLHEAWGLAIAQYATELLAAVPKDEPVALYLAQHGGNPASRNPCGDGGDQYHTHTKAEFALASAAVAEALGDRQVTIRQVYGQGAGAADDGFLSPSEALALDRGAGIRRVVVVPYEFWGNAMDNLVYLRESFGFTPDKAPYYDGGHESHLTVDGISVRIASAQYGTELKATALLSRIADAIVAGIEGQGAAHGTHSP